MTLVAALARYYQALPAGLESRPRYLAAPLAMIRGQSRMRIAIHAERNVNVQAFLRAWLEKPKLPPGIGLSLDIDPQSFL